MIPALVSVGLYLRFNHLRFGELTAFGYERAGARFRRSGLNLREVALAVSAYLFSPALSVFLFAPPLLLAIAGLSESLRRWPLEARTLLLAAGAQLAPIALYRYWHGAPGYGPRYMLAAVLLLMPLTLPALGSIENGASSRRRAAFAAVIVLGLAVQVLGLAVYVNVDTRKLAETGYQDAWSVSAPSPGRWVFVPSLSPPLVHLRELVAGRNVIPWALRAVNRPGLPLVFWAVLATDRRGRGILAPEVLRAR